MGMRLEGPKIDNIVNTNIKSEGLIKGVIQVPADGNPIIIAFRSWYYWWLSKNWSCG